jgi:TolB-like protein/DNA-binding winged helix-turn-helix (wHTH) protein
MQSQTQHIYEFGPFRLDAAERLLLRDGAAVALTPRVFDLLLVLVERHGHLLEKDELLQTIWPDTVVEEGNLTANISILRKTLGDDGNSARFIETVPKRGYRFVAAVRTNDAEAEHRDDLAPEPAATPETIVPAAAERQDAAAPPEAATPPRLSPRRLLFAGVLVGALALTLYYFGNRRTVAPGAIASLAVLPLENLSGDPQQEYFAEGMTDALIGDLAKVGALRVSPRTSAIRYKGSRQPLAQIARELKVEGVVEGTVQRFGDRVQIRARLVHAATEQPLWGETYERDWRNVLAVQSEVAQAIARAVNVAVTPHEQARLTHARQVHPEAYEAYLRARFIWNQRTPATLKTAVEQFERAIKLEANYAPAHAGLADAYCMLSDYGEAPPREAYPKARAAAQRALALDAELAEAHTSLAWIKAAYEWDFAAAEQEFQRALALNPNYATAHQWYGEFLSAQGRHQEAIAEIKRAQQLEPFSLIVNTALAGAYYFAREDEQALAACQKVIELDPNFAQIYDWLQRAYENQGKPRETLAAHQKLAELMGWEQYVAKLRRAAPVADMRDYWQRRLAGGMAESEPSPFWVAECWAQLGDKEQAFVWLEKLCQERSYWAIYLKVVPSLDPFRADPRFADLLRRRQLAP